MTNRATLHLETLAFRKSSYSGGQTACVEVAGWGEGAAVRDSKTRQGGYLTFQTRAWREFTRAVASDALK